MKKLLFLLMLSSISWAQNTYHQKLYVDLNKDGQKELIVLKPYLVEGVTLGQLQVLSYTGKVIWSGPRVQKPYSNSPWSFLGDFDMGDISWIGDYDNDGVIDLCATYQKSDVRPTHFRLFHWNGQKFVFDRSAMLVPAPQKPATYVWKTYSPDATLWVETMKLSTPGTYQLQVFNPPNEPYAMQVRYRQGEGFVFTTP